ncbi:RimJ/RimL family protein N-acetyltransferase [Crossiella equi]|uniref:RimJ/RimL family protein N-acetyltransferase n=1 Tax=Crossiella equi TaxID=130796 RepID=A0ABS5AAB0_9PSEU|nr:GNAT family protein [Crossiella equi]MBP2473523.1 RimJ/RimL family protein N-acetyltransferase [Crossiella equi]
MLTAHAQTQRIALRPIEPGDGTAVYELLLRLGLHSLPPLETFLSTYDRGANAIFRITARHNGETVGFGSLQHLDPHGHIQVGIFTDPDKARLGIGGEAMMLLVNYAFATWEEVRKIYFLTTDVHLEAFGTTLARVPRELTLPEHVYFAGRLWDLHWYAIYREEWTALNAPVLDRLVRGPAVRTTLEPAAEPDSAPTPA